MSSVASAVVGDDGCRCVLPKGKKRTALLRKLKEIFRSYRSQPVGGLIEEINPILRGWVNYFAIGHSSRCFSYIRDWVEKKIRRHLARACQRRGFGWKRWSREWLYGTLGLFNEYRVSYRLPICGSRSSPIGLITLDAKCAGARSAGNPHATCDVAGAGDGATVSPNRARRGKPRTQPRIHLRATAPVLDPTGISGFEVGWHSGRNRCSALVDQCCCYASDFCTASTPDTIIISRLAQASSASRFSTS